MPDERPFNSQQQITILHQTRTKFAHLNSSLLLTSSLLNHKQKITKNRSQKPQHLNLNHPSVLLTTNKFNINHKYTPTTIQPNYSNIEELKYHARQLDKEHIIKIGKENQPLDGYETEKSNIENVGDSLTCKARHIKFNKRKILKGRPEMFAFIKKRKVLGSLEDVPLSGALCQPHIRQTINQILQKQNQASMVTSNFQPHHNTNYYRNYLIQKHENFIEIPPPNKVKRNHLRRTVSSFKTIQHNQKRRVASRDLQSPLCLPKDRHRSLGPRRFSVSNTIQ